MAAALINVPAKRQARRRHRDQDPDVAHHGDRLSPHRRPASSLPRDIITSFTCRYNGAEIFRADLFPAIAANPFITFFTVATESGTFDFEWIGDNGFDAQPLRRRSSSNESWRAR